MAPLSPLSDQPQPISSLSRTSKPRLREHRHRSSRLLRERQIPELNIHCPTFQSAESHIRGQLRSLFQQEDFRPPLSPAIFQHSYSDLEALDCSRSKLIANWSEPTEIDQGSAAEGATQVSLQFHPHDECSGSEGDISETESKTGHKFFKVLRRREGSSSSHSYEGPHVTRAASECSSVSDDSLSLITAPFEQRSVTDWGLQAEGANINLEGITYLQDELELVDDKKEKLSSPLWSSELLKTTGFAREAIRRLEKRQNTSKTSNKMPRNGQDPTDALRQKLQNMLLAVDSCPNVESAASIRNLHDYGEASKARAYPADGADSCAAKKFERIDSPKAGAPDEKRCLVETAALRKHLDFLSTELRETEAAAASIRMEYQYMLSGESGEQNQGRTYSGRQIAGPGQGIVEEVHRKATIRRIAAQVQAETEQWSQVQDILLKLQTEIEDLHEARERWEERALHAEAQLLALKETMYDWRRRAQTAEEEIVVLQAGRQALRNKIEKLQHRLAEEKTKRLQQEASQMKASSMSTTLFQKNPDTEQELQEKPRHASAGIQDTLDICDSIIHSRNGSARNSCDLETVQKGLLKNIKKSLDFSSSSNEGNRKARQKIHKQSDALHKTESRELETSEASVTSNKERNTRKPKQLCFKEDTATNNLQEWLPSKPSNLSSEDASQHFISSKPNASLHAVETRTPLLEIINTFSPPIQKCYPFQLGAHSSKTSL